jgi:hypothetical protein
MSHGRNLSSTSGAPEFVNLLHSNSLKFQPMDVHGTNSFLPKSVSFFKTSCSILDFSVGIGKFH